MKYFYLVFLLACNSLSGQIAVDGIYSDWTAMEFSIDDLDNHPDLDILKVWVSNDDDNLYIRIDTDQEFDLQDAERISIYIDADNNPSTGFSINGLGTEITYYFGTKESYLNYPSGTINGNHSNLDLIAIPTVTSNTFEIAISRTPSSSKGVLEMGNTISISVDNGNNGDAVPNMDGGFEYQMKANPGFETNYDLSKQDSNFTRVMTYNVLFDGLDEPGQKEHLEAVITAMNPDVIAFQEVYNTPIPQIRAFLNEALPNSSGRSWDGVRAGSDVVVFTRGYLEAYDPIDGNGVFLLYDEFGQNPLIIYNVHLPCCDRDTDRQLEIDKILSVLRDKEQSPLTHFLYQDDTPIIITGDFNMVGFSQNIKSFVEGDIVNENMFGNDFNPDWDGSFLEDANPYVTGYPSNYTWKKDNSAYNPGKLDFIYYTGSVMTQQNGFVLDTEFLNQSELDALGLNANSTKLASDHLPVIVDFTLGIIDNDMDGFAQGEDCDDNDPAINPDAVEIPNNDVDEDCDGIKTIIDDDMDGFNSDEDCDDQNAAVNPDAVEIPNNDVDEDCDGEKTIIDEDMDGFNSDEDCDDQNAAINPDAIEIPNNDVDEDCDGEKTIIDEDMDGYNSDEDCDDTDPAINPGAFEIPNNNVDENCDGEFGIVDLDMDGFTSDEDCNDMDSLINPMAIEIPNNDVDEDCDGIKLIIDDDMDGFNSDEDCDDLDSLIFPGAIEIPNNGIDEDCDGEDLISSTYDLFKLDWNVYPNPIEDVLYITSKNGETFKYHLVDMNGRVISRSNFILNSTILNCQDLTPGIYTLMIDTKSGLEYALKVVKL